jgi:hypothetical protein
MTLLHNTLQATVFSILLITLSAPVALATTIIAVRTPDMVVMASDSAAIYRLGDHTTVHLVCKIFVVNEAVFAMSGRLVGSSPVGFDAAQLVDKALLTRESIATAVQEIQPRLISELRKALTYLSAHDPTTFEYTLRERREEIISILTASIESDEPVAVKFTIGVTGDTIETLKFSTMTDSCPGNCPTGLKHFVLGSGDAIYQYVKSHQGPWEIAPELRPAFLVNIEIQAGTPGVASPVDVVRLDKTRISWLARKAECHDQPTEFPTSFNRGRPEK